MRFWITEGKILEWANNINIFFVLAIGRSGTRFLAELLNQIPGAYVAHEPVDDDYLAHQKAFHNEKEAVYYVQRFRRKEIYLRVRDREVTTYGEVNSLLRRHCNALKRAFPNAHFVHLVRDGRDVARSMMSRKTMTHEDPHTTLIYPTNADPWKDEWDEMSRFEKLCWYWQVENHYLRNNIERTVQLERLISSYDYFSKQLLCPLDLNVPKSVWQAAVDRPKNATEQYEIPHWTSWERQRKTIFREICGEEMNRLGYEI